jgi:uncharacterized protein (TIGR00645 family)
VRDEGVLVSWLKRYSVDWKEVNRLQERFVFESRWLLYPFNVGLILALCVYVVRFISDDIYFVRHSFSLGLEEVVVLLLGLVDSYMVANLLIMIIKGSYQIFIHKFSANVENRPGWLDHIDTGLLKVKMSQSIASITGVALLKDFVNVERGTWLLVEHRIVVHMICLISALVMAWIWRITHVPEPAHHAEPQSSPAVEHPSEVPHVAHVL